MKKISVKAMILAVLAIGFSISINAQATRTFVSGVGDDINPCSRTAPCKTFAGAISKTATNGEINCLDPGGYGAVTITKSIMIDCTGTFGSILSSGTNGVVINITLATDTKKAVKLRGLSIDGASTGINGVRIIAANSVAIENSVLDGFTTHGISVATSTGTPKIVVDHTTIRSTGGNGINTFIAGGTVSLAVSNSNISNTITALNLSGNTKAAISNSTLSNNSNGIGAANAEVVATACIISGNATGISSIQGGNIIISGNTISGNTTGLSATGGSITSFANNSIIGNSNNGAATAFATQN